MKKNDRLPHIGIVGHEGAKFTREAEQRARDIIRALIFDPCCVVSGACHLGGVDVWAEEEAKRQGRPTLIFPPAKHSWADGYKPRNIRIAQASDVVHVIVVRELPPDFKGLQHKGCYHCGMTTSHIKSGGCWTARYAEKLGHRAEWHVV